MKRLILLLTIALLYPAVMHGQKGGIELKEIRNDVGLEPNTGIELQEPDDGIGLNADGGTDQHNHNNEFCCGAEGNVYASLTAAELFEHAKNALENTFPKIHTYLYSDKGKNAFSAEIREIIQIPGEEGKASSSSLWYNITAECSDGVCSYTFTDIEIDLPTTIEDDPRRSSMLSFSLHNLGFSIIPENYRQMEELKPQMDALFAVDVSAMSAREKKRHYNKLSSVMDSIEAHLGSLALGLYLWEEANDILERDIAAFHGELMRLTSAAETGELPSDGE